MASILHENFARGVMPKMILKQILGKFLVHVLPLSWVLVRSNQMYFALNKAVLPFKCLL